MMIDGLLLLSRNQRYVPQMAEVNIEAMLDKLIDGTRQTEQQAPELEKSDISVSARILAEFSDDLAEEQLTLAKKALEEIRGFDVSDEDKLRLLSNVIVSVG